MHLVRQDAGDAGELRGQQVAELRTFSGDRFEPIQLRGGDGSLWLAHAIVGREHLKPASLDAVAALVAKLLQRWPDTLVVRRHHAAIAAGDVLGFLQRKAGDVADRADRLAAELRTPGLRT